MAIPHTQPINRIVSGRQKYANCEQAATVRRDSSKTMQAIPAGSQWYLSRIGKPVTGGSFSFIIFICIACRRALDPLGVLSDKSDRYDDATSLPSISLRARKVRSRSIRVLQLRAA